MSTRKGLYVVRSSVGPESVQVSYGGGIQMPMAVSEYRAQGISPPLESLPDVKTYHASATAHAVKYDDWKNIKGKRLRVQIGHDTLEGPLLGIDNESVVSDSNGHVVHPWLMESGGDHHAFVPGSPGVKIHVYPDEPADE